MDPFSPPTFKVLTVRLLGGIYCLEEAALSPLSDTASQIRYINPWEQTPSYAPTPGYFGCERTVSGYSPDQRGFIRDTEWDQAGTDTEEEWPSFTRYMIEWRVTLNNRVVAKDTEQDLALNPSSYWQDIKHRAESILHRKIARNRPVRLDDTTVVVSVNDRSQRDLTKRFERTDLD